MSSLFDEVIWKTKAKSVYHGMNRPWFFRAWLSFWPISKLHEESHVSLWLLVLESRQSNPSLLMGWASAQRNSDKATVRARMMTTFIALVAVREHVGLPL